MTPDRWRQVTEIFHAALARDASAREAFLRDACEDDPSLRGEVEALVAAHQDAGSFGDRPVVVDSSARLSPGTRLGTYLIDGLLGAGGMGEVYRARDTDLGRQVAIKILPGAFLANADGRARLGKEARLLAALNHPHIAAIHGVVEADGVRGLVLELVEGATLAERLSNGPLPLTEALHVASQIADALDATHEKGIVHRDLKPANIKITPDGIVKVLDFGLAKALHGEISVPGGPEWSTTGLSRDGVIVGTAAYMSPEQARGQAVDRRTDIWAFGCVLYEMLTGRRVFDGETTTDVLAAIVSREPDWTALPAGVSPSVRHLLKRCLEKDPTRRLRNLGDARAELEESVKTGRTRRAFPRGQSSAVGAALLVVAVVLLSWPSIRSRFAGSRPEPSVVTLTSYPGREENPSFSPDGRLMAFRWNGESEDNFDIYYKLVGPGDPHRLTTDPAVESWPKWSPDGNWIAFLRAPAPVVNQQQLGPNPIGVYVIPALGGIERKVGDAFWVFGSPTLSWLDGKSLVVSRRPAADQPPALFSISVETGALTRLTSPAAPHHDGSGAVAPNGEVLAFKRVLGINHIGSLMILPLSPSGQPNGEPKEIGIDKRIRLNSVAWSAGGHEIIYSAGWSANNSSLWRVAASNRHAPERLTVAGEGALEPAISRDGKRLVFSRYLGEVNIWSLELDETGRPTSEALRAFDSSKTELCPAFSPDGTRVALESNRLGTDEIWVCTSNMSCSKLTSFAGPHAGSPAWSPDGQWIAFDGLGDTGSGIYTIRSDGGPLHRLADGSAPRWSRDGRWIYYSNGIAAQLYRIASSGGEPVALGGPGWVPQESADGWVHYSLSPNADATTLRRTRPAGGEASDVLSESVAGRNFVVVDGGIWYLTPYTRAQGSLLRFYDFATETTRTVFRTERPVAPGMTLAPDGRRILFTQLDRHGSDLMLIENFR